MQSLSVLEASVREVTHAYKTALQDNQPNEAEFWRVVLLERLVALSDALTANQGNTRAKRN